MITLPTFVTVPVLMMYAPEVSLPSLGAVVAWALIAALVGSGIGLLRGNTRSTAVPARRKPSGRSTVSTLTHLDRADVHQEAA